MGGNLMRWNWRFIFICVILNRRVQPEAYRLYLELMRQYSHSFPFLGPGACREKIIKSIDATLQLSHIYRVEKMDFGIVIVLFVLRAVTTLVDSVLEDFGLPFASKFVVEDRWPHPIDLHAIDRGSNYSSKHHDHLRQTNIMIALEVLVNMTSKKRIQVFLRAVHLNMPKSFDSFHRRLQFIKEHMSSGTILMSINHLLEKLLSNVEVMMNVVDRRTNKHCLQEHLDDKRLVNSPLSFLTGAGKAGCWISFDIIMENAMDGRKTVCPIAAFEKLAELTRKLQLINQASWQETFQALWISALRLVQRAREPVSGPVPHLDSRLCLLLSIVPLTIAILLKEESDAVYGIDSDSTMKQGLVACLQSLMQFTGLLSPPEPVIEAANNAATKAAVFVSKNKMQAGDLRMIPQNNCSPRAMGSLLHLMVEACISRDLIDTSAYFWPGYVVGKTCPQTVLIQDSQWSNFMQGAPLGESLQSALIATPAPSVAELKKLTHLALNGSEKERLVAPKILCAASLIRGWNIQEHTVCALVKLLSPPVPSDAPASGEAKHFLCHVHMLTATLSSLCHTDIVHILWLHGVIPEVIAALIPLCEVFGSLQPPSTYRSSTSEEVSVYTVFSLAFLFLLRLYKFYVPSQGHYSSGRTGPVRPELTLDYFLLMRNNIIPNKFTTKNADCANIADPLDHLPHRSIYIDSFPKLRAWYFQNQACVASILSGLCNPRPVLDVTNKIFNMIFWKENKGGQGVLHNSCLDSNTDTSSHSSRTSTTSLHGSSQSTSTSISEDEDQVLPLLPAWQVLEAIPIVLEAFLTACANGRLSSRQLTTGLRDLVDFFPASIAAIVTYCSAEITRGIWKDVPMNGTDWPNPSEALYSFESGVKEVLASTGVHIQSFYPRGMPPMLPLPLAALLSLFITFKMDKSLEYARAVVGRAAIYHAVHSNWPGMLICGAIGYQKLRKWQDFLIVTLSCSTFTHDRDAVVQLIRSCFRAFLGPVLSDCSSVTSARGVVGLLGQSLSNIYSLSPGILFLRTYHLFHDPHFISEVILKLVIECACNLAQECTSGSPTRLKSGVMSLTESFSTARQVAILGASLLYVAGQEILVQVLFEETVPTILLSANKERSGTEGSFSSLLEGYAISYLMFFSSAIFAGFRSASSKIGSSKRHERIITSHLNFMARVFEHNIVLNCDPTLWKTHVRCFLGLVVRFVPSWIQSMKLDVLQKLSNVLKVWQEHDLALSLLELGGTGAIEVVVKSLF
ncbi:hypothetical protein LUZ63_011934 [Rhynchospora breviuscula]|uniref:Mediator of RNA polymerase II transcription subunit 33A n=1 Tax=Rhynchospora breviuscula TaxID=2022672 RepID=A0A9Q0CJU4_9POAL|nr:hypothetical protein LUZ63_011934 [Rhynchospora breviuscula]